MARTIILLETLRRGMLYILLTLLIPGANLLAQGVTTAALSGVVTSDKGEALAGANVVVVHEPTGTRYGASVRPTGQYNIPNMRIGGPYSVTASLVGYKSESKRDVYLNLGQDVRVDFRLVEEAIEGKEVVVTAQVDPVLNSGTDGCGDLR